jgi:hypothetical protein
MSGAILSLPQYASMAWCSVKAQGQLYLLLYIGSYFCISGGRLLQPQPEDGPCHCDRDPLSCTCWIERIVLLDFSVQWLGHLLPPVFDWLQGFMCVCAQVSCSVVSN